MRAILPILALLLGYAALVAPSLAGPATAQGSPTIGIDANPSGNEHATLSDIETCVSVTSGEEFDIDVFIRDVDELLAWEMYVEYDPAILEIIGRDVEMFLAGNPDSSVLDVSSALPNRDGLYRAAAADTSDPPTPDSGSGVLFRLTLRALASGSSKVNLAVLDIDDDGAVDIGPLLRNVDGEILGDSDGNTIFDGPIENAEVAVDSDAACPESTPSDTLSTSSGEDSINWALVALAAGGGSAGLLISGLVARRLLKGRRTSS